MGSFFCSLTMTDKAALLFQCTLICLRITMHVSWRQRAAHLFTCLSDRRNCARLWHHRMVPNASNLSRFCAKAGFSAFISKLRLYVCYSEPDLNAECANQG